MLHVQQFPVCIKNGPPAIRHPVNLTRLWKALESTWASIPVECFWHIVVHAQINWGCSEGKRWCNSILGRRSVFHQSKLKSQGIRKVTKQMFTIFFIKTYIDYRALMHRGPCTLNTIHPHKPNVFHFVCTVTPELHNTLNTFEKWMLCPIVITIPMDLFLY
jgi:hypothetical protein